jgi:hypothetical protein
MNKIVSGLSILAGRRTGRALGVLAVAAVALAVFNRVALVSGLDAVPGDVGDGRFNLAVLEHWYRVALGAEPWASPGFYFPVPGVLGYSDALVLLAPEYGAARWAGLDPVAALAVTLMAASALGFAGMVLFLRRLLGLVWPATLAGAGAFATGTVLYQSLSVGHVQMMTVEALPWFACLAWCYARDGGRQAGGRWAGAAMALLLAAILSTSFYVGWFVGIQLLVMAAVGLVMALSFAGAGRTLAEAGSWLAGRRRSLLVTGAVLVLGLVPFLVLYGPVALHSAGRPWEEVARTLPDVAQLLEARGNGVWGPVAVALWPALSGQGGEMGKGLSWGLLLVFLLTLVRMAWRPATSLSPELRRLVLVLGASVIVCWLLMLRVDGWSPWALVYQGIPGGRGIRSVFRFNLVLSFSVATVAAIGLHAAWCGARGLGGPAPVRMGGRVAVALVAAALIAEQVNVLPGILSRSRDFAEIAAIQPPPPTSCRALVLLPAAPLPAYHRWSHQLGMVMLAQAWGLPTLNGYSGSAPAGWALFDPTDGVGYRRAVVAWADRYAVWERLCGIDPEARRWFPVSRADLIPASLVIDPLGASPPNPDQGFAPEPTKADGPWNPGFDAGPGASRSWWGFKGAKPP